MQRVATFRYGGRDIPRFFVKCGRYSAWVGWFWVWAGLVLAGWVYWAWLPWLGIVLGVAWLVVCIGVSYREKVLTVTEGFVMDGLKVIHYGNLQKIVIDEKRLTCVLRSHGGHTIAIEAEKFPTGARKEFKVKRNRANKFYKAVEAILNHVDQSQPGLISILHADQLKKYLSEGVARG